MIRILAALFVAACAASGVAAQTQGAEVSLRIGAAAATILERTGAGGALQGSLTWPIDPRWRVGIALEVVRLFADDCPTDTGCDDPPGNVILAGVRIQRNRTGVYGFAQPAYLGWAERRHRHDSFGLGLGIGYREPGAPAGFVLEAAVTPALQSELTAIFTLTTGFAFGLRIPDVEFPVPPTPVPPDPAK